MRRKADSTGSQMLDEGCCVRLKLWSVAMNPQEHEVDQRLVLSDRDRDAFLAALENPPLPNEALVRAARNWRAARKSGELKDQTSQDLDHADADY